MSSGSLERVCLAVDDEPAVRTYIKSILDSEQFRTLEAEGAADALRIVHRLGGAVDLIVSDIKMPGDMDGIDLAHSVRLAFPSIPIILMSGQAEVRTDSRPLAFDFLQKPFRPEVLLEAIQRLTAMQSHSSRI